MSHSHQIVELERERERDDRLSSLSDVVLGHILSFLDADEIGRAAALSRRWRDVLAIVHTVSLDMDEQPKRPIIYDVVDDNLIYSTEYINHPPAPLSSIVTGALFGRSRRPAPAPGPVPLRALRVCLGVRLGYNPDQKTTVDQWVTYALKHAGPDLELDLRLGRDPICKHPDRAAHARPYEVKAVGWKPPETNADDHSPLGTDDDDGDDVGSSSEENFRGYGEYTVPWGGFSCPALRSLRLGACRISPPAALSMPWLEALRLTQVPDEEEHVQRLISACPHLVDLTLEACGTVTTLSLLGNTRLRSLALRCCHKLATVVINTPELRSFEYRGAVPGDSFLTMVGGSPSIMSFKVDICAICVGEATSEEELSKLDSFVQQFVSTTKHLHLSCAFMGSSFARLPAFTSLRHLQLIGHVPRDSDDPAAAAAATSKILWKTPNLETLSLLFEVKRRNPNKYDPKEYDRGDRSEGQLLDAHLLNCNKYDSLDVPASSVTVPACLSSRVRKINLLHYQGGRAQRMLVRFLVRNTEVLEKLYCGFAEGPLWIQMELKREIERWAVNGKTSTEFR
ncbi:unnamed protein product [Triticum turgidum subsp. durum]|uniref:F-box domain-containing protein n=1 Tax=Triticum turgidum subsp. durum TaxID=4567 RepID=A0A9R1QVF2_TRITD|nr:unnamed protein product [Triticum turgidum subsp. durum]